MEKYVFLIFAVFFLCSCSTEVENENDLRNLDPVGSDIKVILLEKLSKEGPQLKIMSETVEHQPCINFEIITEYHYAPENLRVNYSGIYKPKTCFTAIGPATSEGIFLFEKGSYEVEFLNEGVSNRGELIVDDEKYSMELFSPENVFLERETLYKIPENAYWGIIGYHEESSAALVQEFRDELKAEDVVFGDYADGEYGYFEIINGEMQLPGYHGYHFAEPLIFQFEGSTEELKEIIRNFILKHGNDISIGLNSFRGEELSSYDL